MRNSFKNGAVSEHRVFEIVTIPMDYLEFDDKIKLSMNTMQLNQKLYQIYEKTEQDCQQIFDSSPDVSDITKIPQSEEIVKQVLEFARNL